jgi:hypothetical protein
MSTSTIDHHCPTWCTIRPAEHDRELPDWEGGALHWSDDQEVAVVEGPGQGRRSSVRVQVAVATDAGGTVEERTIYIGDTRVTLEGTREVMAALGSAVEAASA